MKQSSHITGSLPGKKIVFLMVVCVVLTIVSLGYGQDNVNNFVFNGKNGISNNASAGKAPASFTAELGRKLADGIEVTAAGSQYPVKLIPITITQGVGTRKGNSITYAIAPGVHIIYTRKSNGVKEDIVFDNPSSAPSEFAFRLELDPMLEARLDKKGNIVIYGPNSILSGFIQTGDAKSAELIMKARQHAPKDNLLFIIPAPIIIDGQGRKHKDIAHYEMEKSILTLHSGKIAELSAPVSIDPSIVVTTTADFMKGNNEGMISFDTDAISRTVLTGGAIGAWTTTTSFTTGRYGHASVLYNGFLYITGGYSSSGGKNDVQFAPINADGTIGAWTATTSFSNGRSFHTSVAYNNYLYVIGGWSGAYHNDIQYAPINANGTVGTWAATTSFAGPRSEHTSVAFNGFLYIIGGQYNASKLFNDVQYAPFNADGTVGAWITTTSFSIPRCEHTSVAYNGYLYVLGGFDGSLYYNDVQVASINTNGSVGSWIATNSFPTARSLHSSIVFSGNLYVIAGVYGVGGNLNDVNVAPINTNGTIGIWTPTTSLPADRYSHASVAYNGRFYIIGGFNGTVYFNDVLFAPVKPSGSARTWTATTSFSTSRFGHTSIAYNSFLYVIGGYNGTSYLNDVQFASINADGTVGTWTTTMSFATARNQHTSVVYNGYLYILGGYSGSAYLSDVQFAPIHADGTVGTWTATTSLTSVRSGHTSVSYNGYLYVLGGRSGGIYYNDVLFAPINANGTLGTWATTTSFTTARYLHSSVAYNGYLYVLGGFNAVSFFNDVQFVHFNADGTVGAWNTTTSFTTARYGHTSVAYNGYLYVIGGYNDTSFHLNDVQYVPINLNGTLGTWITASSFANARYLHSSVAYNGYLYVLGGYNSMYLNDVQYALINDSGTVSTWTATTSFTTARYIHTSVAYNGYLYVLGGYNGTTFFNDVQYAPINADGTVGAWTITTSFNTARYGHTSVAYNGYLYVLGGYNGTHFNDVQYAPINANGTIGAWNYTTSFATARRVHSSLVYNGYLYVIGGYVGGTTYLADVQYAPVNADGTVGTWAATTSLTEARYGHKTVAYNGYLYVLGGYSGSYRNDVQFAPIYLTGAIGSWTNTSSFSPPHFAHAAAAYNGHIYIIGGTRSSGSYLNDVQFAPINSDGTIAEWISTNSFTTLRTGHTSVVYNGYVYILGGYNGTYLNDVQVATLIGPAAQGRYSKLLDIGSDKIVDFIVFDNNIRKGVTNITHALAPSTTAIFGTRTTIPNAKPAQSYVNGFNTCARYIWVHWELDDTQSATIDGGGLNDRTDLADFAIYYSELTGIGSSLHLTKSSPNVHLTWSTSPKATSYNVLRCNAAAPPCIPITIASPSTNTYDDGILADSNTYWYRIEAVNGSCVSGLKAGQ